MMIFVVKVLACFILDFGLSTADVKDENIKTVYKAETLASVIIIGSGASGIAAASRLAEYNFTNFKILEAGNRVGGRIKSVPFAGSIIDLGAEWCTGEEGNVVYELAGSLNVLADDPYDNVSYYHSSQQRLEQEFIKEIHDKTVEIFVEVNNDGVESTLGDFMQNRYRSAILKKYGNDSTKISLAHDFLKYFELEVLTEEGAFSWFDVAAKRAYKRIPGRDLGWNGRGYKTILDVLTRKLPDPSNELPVYKNVIFDKSVVKISLNGNIPSVKCSDGSMFTANHIIWTPSIGVLKDGYEHLFKPALPSEKVKAIKALGIAGVGKILYYFSHPWWPKYINQFSFLWSEEDSQNAWKEFPYGFSTEGRSWVVSLQMFDVNPFNGNILTAWACGKALPGIEQLQDEVIINGTMYVLHKFLGHQFNITRPEKIIREKWYSNDHFRGVYSYDTPESLADGVSQREILSKPLTASDKIPLVLFAGEATSPMHYGTVHGAIEAGRREADKLITYYKENFKQM